MTSGIADTIEHPLEALVGGVRAAVGAHSSAPAWTVRPSRIAPLLADLVAAQNALDAVRLRLLREADRHQLGDAEGHTSTANWWAAQTRMTRPAAHREVRLAEALDDSDHEQTAEALTSGVVSLDQVAVILHAVEELPVDLVGPALRRQAEADLVALAHELDPKKLRIAGHKILEVAAPEIAEEIERKRLEREEQHALATASFTMRNDGEGSMWGRFKIPVLAGEILAKHLNALAAPKHQRATTDTPITPRVSRPLKLGAAFVEYLETRAAAGMPRAGGVPATVVVTMTMENLLGTSELAALLDTGESISASEARRLACEAGIIPAVLGSPTQVLDLGRKTRFHTEPQRIALMLRDRGCSAEGCDWPPGMCHAHHDRPWALGGDTNVKDGRLFCPRHHTMSHDSRYQRKNGSSGKVIFSRRT